MSLGNEAFLREVISEIIPRARGWGEEGRARTRARPVSKGWVAGTRVAFSETGGMWIYSAVTASCLLGLTSVGTFPKSKTCLKWLCWGGWSSSELMLSPDLWVWHSTASLDGAPHSEEAGEVHSLRPQAHIHDSLSCELTDHCSSPAWTLSQNQPWARCHGYHHITTTTITTILFLDVLYLQHVCDMVLLSIVGSLFHSMEISWRRKWQCTLVFLPGEFHGQRSLVGYSPWGCKSWTWLSD